MGMDEKEREPALEEKGNQTDHFFEELFVPSSSKDAKQKDAVLSPKKPLKQEVEWRDVVLSKKAWFLLVFVLLLLYFSAAVPVAHIPVLNVITEAMGYTDEEMENTSFLKAFFTWPGHAKRRKAQDTQDELIRRSMAASMAASTEEAQLNRAQLINFRAASQRRATPSQREAQADTLSRAAMANASKESQTVVMSGKESTVSTQEEQPRGLPGEVYFGTEADLIARNQKDGFDSTKRLAAVKKPGAIDSHKSDWTLDAADSFWAHQGGIIFDNKLLNNSISSMTPGQNIISAVDVKPRMDVVYAWLTSRAGRRTNNLMLKKTLEAAGFMGTDLSKPMLLTGVSGGGIPLESDKMYVDLKDAKKRAKLEEDCTNYLEGNGYRNDIIQPMEHALALRDGDNSMPGLSDIMNDCEHIEEQANMFTSRLEEIQETCKSIQNSFNSVGNTCRITIVQGTCSNGTYLPSYAINVKTECEGRVQACVNANQDSTQTPEQKKAACYPIASAEIFTGDFKEGLKQDIRGVMGTTSETGGVSYFTSVDWGETLFNRSYGGVLGEE